jgi:hypothetical protein
MPTQVSPVFEKLRWTGVDGSTNLFATERNRNISAPHTMTFPLHGGSGHRSDRHDGFAMVMVAPDLS